MTLLTKMDTADQGTSKFSVLWLILKGIPIEKSYIGKLYYCGGQESKRETALFTSKYLPHLSIISQGFPYIHKVSTYPPSYEGNKVTTRYYFLQASRDSAVRPLPAVMSPDEA
jgi:hypothetical protein